jgi:hypothetical protein
MSEVVYHTERYNVTNDTEQWIRLTDGCFRNCWNCYCPAEKKVYPCPEIIRKKVVILDMNFLYAHDHPLETIKWLSTMDVHYDFYCGLDFTLLTQDTCNALRPRFGRFNNKRNFIPGIRLAWDRTVREQKEMKAAIQMLLKAGYRAKNLQIFMLCNGKSVPFVECVQKLNLMKVWNVQVADCWYDNQKRGSVVPDSWTGEQCLTFGRLCREHNQIVIYGIYPEMKGAA